MQEHALEHTYATWRESVAAMRRDCSLLRWQCGSAAALRVSGMAGRGAALSNVSAEVLATL
eukprot:6027187-Pleurochrysis_carterae.AAC.1